RSRRVIDRLTGYKISPILWDKFNVKGLSAGRVQSAILSILAEREKEITSFVPVEYFKVSMNVNTTPAFSAELAMLDDGNEVQKIEKLDKERAEAIFNELNGENV